MKLALKRAEYLRADLLFIPMTLTPEEQEERINLLHLEAMELADRLSPSWDDSVESVALAREHVLHIAPDEEVDKEASTCKTR